MKTIVSASLAVFVLSAYSAVAATISAVSIINAPANPTITVSGTGFGTAPTATFLGFPGFTGFDYGKALYITDFSPTHGFDAGGDAGENLRDLIGLVILNYTDNQVQFQLGSDYAQFYLPNNIYSLSIGDPYTVVVNGASFSGTVGSTGVTPEPESLVTLLTGLASTGLFAFRRNQSIHG